MFSTTDFSKLQTVLIRSVFGRSPLLVHQYSHDCHDCRLNYNYTLCTSELVLITCKVLTVKSVHNYLIWVGVNSSRAVSNARPLVAKRRGLRRPTIVPLWSPHVKAVLRAGLCHTTQVISFEELPEEHARFTLSAGTKVRLFSLSTSAPPHPTSDSSCLPPFPVSLCRSCAALLAPSPV